VSVAAAGSRYLAVTFPWLSADRLRHTRAHLFAGRVDPPPVIFVEGAGRTSRVAAMDAAAAQIGIEIGMALPSAKALVPALETFPDDPRADLDWLDQLALGCERYTGNVAVCPPNALVLRFEGGLGDFPSERALAADVEDRLARRRLQVRQAFANTPYAAQALARFPGAAAPDEAGAIRRLPVAALDLEDEEADLMAEAGLKTVGDVAARPTTAISSQFGRHVVEAVRRLSATAPSPRPTAPPPLRVERRSTPPLMRIDDLASAVSDLMVEAGMLLDGRRQLGRRWQLTLFRADGCARQSRTEGGAAAAVTGRLLAGHGNSCGSADEELGYDLVRLDALLVEPVGAGELYTVAVGPQAEPALPRKSGTGRRGSAEPSQLALFASTEPPVAPPAAYPSTMAEQPIHLFDPPQRLDAVTADIPVGTPTSFRWRRRHHEVARADGPEQIADHRARRGLPPRTRDYYRLQDRRGRRFWIFRQVGEDEQLQWFVHGLFA